MAKQILNTIKKKIRLFTEYPFLKIEDQLVDNNSNNKIPNRVYQTWETRFLGKLMQNLLKNLEI